MTEHGHGGYRGHFVVAQELHAPLDRREDEGFDFVGELLLAVIPGHDEEVGEEILQLVEF